MERELGFKVTVPTMTVTGSLAKDKVSGFSTGQKAPRTRVIGLKDLDTALGNLRLPTISNLMKEVSTEILKKVTVDKSIIPPMSSTKAFGITTSMKDKARRYIPMDQNT
jgi:hypothetical protein